MDFEKELINIIQEYYKDEYNVKNDQDRNSKRKKVNTEKINPLINEFMVKIIGLDEFKSRIDGLNKKYKLWGYSGTAGAMFFNLVRKAEEDTKKLEENLKRNILVPQNINEAKEKIQNFSNYIRGLGEHMDDKSRTPAPKSSIFFLSYYWHIQKPNIFPIFYPNSRNALENLLDFNENQINDYSDMYLEFDNIIKEIQEICEKKEKCSITLNEVSNILSWYLNIYLELDVKVEWEIEQGDIENFIPPIVVDLEKIANNDIEMREKYGKENLGTLFEKKVHEVFRLFGFKVKPLGQGKGNNPDGIAMATEGKRFAIIYDTKARSEKYRLGTDYRTIRDYIESYKRSLRREGYEDIYFMIISSDFKDEKNMESKINELIKNTSINGFIFLKARYLLNLLGKKIKDPIIEVQDFREIFTHNGIIKVEELEQIVPDLPEI